MSGSVTIVGGGLAGSEAARVLSAAGLPVRLFEMRPVRTTPAHQTGELAEIVCSNSLGSLSMGVGKGVLLQELQQLGSLVVQTARDHAVPAGPSLAVDRAAFASSMTVRVRALAGVEIVREEVTRLPTDGACLLATGPLTSAPLAAALSTVTGGAQLYFYDAVAPIVSADSLDRSRIFAASRYGKGPPDFLNCPLDAARYEAFVDAVATAQTVPARDFEQSVYFEGCLPIEAMVERGRRTLAFGPMKPVGLLDPRTGRRPHAVVQLRREDRHGKLYNLVGFQTKLTWPEQKRVFRTLPGFEAAEFVRLGSVHRNTFLNAPALLAEDLSLRSRRDLWIAGLLAGVEGYAECAALGLVAALAIVARRDKRVFEPPPRTTMLGALLAYLREADPRHFQPMNVNFGLLPPLARAVRDKRERREALAHRALADLAAWMERSDLAWLRGASLRPRPGARAVSAP